MPVCPPGSPESKDSQKLAQAATLALERKGIKSKLTCLMPAPGFCLILTTSLHGRQGHLSLRETSVIYSNHKVSGEGQN